MTDEIWQRDEVDSPCVKVCVIDPQTRLCLGCNRSIDEIAAWPGMMPEQRREIIAALPGRNPAPARRGGRRGRHARRAMEVPQGNGQ